MPSNYDGASCPWLAGVSPAKSGPNLRLDIWPIYGIVNGYELWQEAGQYLLTIGNGHPIWVLPSWWKLEANNQLWMNPIRDSTKGRSCAEIEPCLAISSNPWLEPGRIWHAKYVMIFDRFILFINATMTHQLLSIELAGTAPHWHESKDN